MKTLTDVDYQKCHNAAMAEGSDDAKLGDWFDQAMRRGIDKALELAAEPICERCEFGDGRDDLDDKGQKNLRKI